MSSFEATLSAPAVTMEPTTVIYEEEPPSSPATLPVILGEPLTTLELPTVVSPSIVPLALAPLTVGVTPRRTRATNRLPAKPKTTSATRDFRKAFFPDVADRDWNDWRWQSRNRIRTLDKLERMLELSADERQAMADGGSMLPVGVTPY